MNFKRYLLGILLAANINGACSHSEPVIFKASLSSRFEDNNLSLNDKLIIEAAQSVQLVEASARYKVNYFGDVYEDELTKRGSAILLSEINGEYYFLTAHHVVDMPPTISSTASLSQSSISRSSAGIETLLDLEVGKGIKKALTSSIAAATMIGNYDLSVGGINGGRIVCSDESLDYAVVAAPRNNQLVPLNHNPQLMIGNSGEITAADYTYTIGYSLALGRFTSAGNISSENLPLGMNNHLRLERRDAFSFTSPISRGNSGGPVLATAGGKLYLIGIAVAYFVDGQNLNIAMKINDILADIGKRGCLDLTKLK